MATRQTGGIANISNYIKNTVIPSVTSIRSANIYDYEPMDLQGFPAVTISSSEVLATVLDNSRNKRVYRFTIRVFIDRNAKNLGSNVAESVLRSVADEIQLVLDSDPTLGGNCIHSMPAPLKFGYVDRESNNIRLVEIQFDAIDAITWR